MATILEQYVSLLYQKAKCYKKPIPAKFTDGRAVFEVIFKPDEIEMRINYPCNLFTCRTKSYDILNFIKNIKEYDVVPTQDNTQVLERISGIKEIKKVKNLMDRHRNFELNYLDSGVSSCFYLTTDSHKNTAYYKVYKYNINEPYIMTSDEIISHMYNSKCEFHRD